MHEGGLRQCQKFSRRREEKESWVDLARENIHTYTKSRFLSESKAKSSFSLSLHTDAVNNTASAERLHALTFNLYTCAYLCALCAD